MPVFNEYVTHGKEVTNYQNAQPYVSASDASGVTRVSRTYDGLDSRQHANLNDFDKKIKELNESE